MPEFRPMRRKRQQLSDAESVRILQEATSGVLALLGDEGYPYAVPLSYVYLPPGATAEGPRPAEAAATADAPDLGRLIFHSAVAGHKVDAMRACPKASFCVIQQDEVSEANFTTFFRSIIAFGTIRILDNDQEKLDAIRALARRYSPHVPAEHMNHEIAKGFPHLLMFELRIQHLTGKEAIELVNAHPHPTA